MFVFFNVKTQSKLKFHILNYVTYWWYW